MQAPGVKKAVTGFIVEPVVLVTSIVIASKVLIKAATSAKIVAKLVVDKLYH